MNWKRNNVCWFLVGVMVKVVCILDNVKGFVMRKVVVKV